MSIASSAVSSEPVVAKSPIDAYIRENAPRLAKVARALVSRASDVEPALEEVVASLRGQKVGDADVFGALRRACSTREARTSRQGLATPTQPSASSEAPTTERSGAAADAVRARAMLGGLKPTEREAVVLHAIGGLAVADVALACGVDEATARARISRGMVALAGKTEEG